MVTKDLAGAGKKEVVGDLVKSNYGDNESNEGKFLGGVKTLPELAEAVEG